MSERVVPDHRLFSALTPRRPLGENIFVSASPIHGLGCFARRCIRAGEWIGAYEGEPTMKDSIYVLWVDVGAEGSEDWRGVDGVNGLRHMNHSSRGNAQFDGLDLYALRPIEPGEEITFHYGDEWDDVD